jgi:biotin transport system substrate-specific component
MSKQKTLTGYENLEAGVDHLHHPPLALIFWSSGGLIRGVILVIAGSLFVALAAQIAIPLPFSPVPITGQTFAVALTGALLGGRRGALALLAYLTEGAVGLPFFAGGAGGVAVLTGYTAGYLMGFMVAAFVVGSLCERGWDRRLATLALTLLIGDTLILLFGVTWLARFIGTGQAIEKGLIPFLPGDLFKIALAALVITGMWGWIKRKRPVNLGD